MSENKTRDRCFIISVSQIQDRSLESRLQSTKYIIIVNSIESILILYSNTVVSKSDIVSDIIVSNSEIAIRQKNAIIFK